MSYDPEVQRLVITTVRAYAIAERLAHELDKTVNTLESFMSEKPPVFGPQQKEEPHDE